MSDDFDALLRQRLSRLAEAVPVAGAQPTARIARRPVRAGSWVGPGGLAVVAAVALLVAIVGLRPLDRGPAALGSPPASAVTVQTVVPDFVLTLTAPKATWRTDDVISVTATLRYTGTAAAGITTSGNGPFGFGVSDSAGVRTVEPGWEDSCVAEPVQPGQVWTKSFYKSGAANSDFSSQFLHDPLFHLPAGSWNVTVDVSVGMGGCGVDVRSFSASLPITVTSATAAPTAAAVRCELTDTNTTCDEVIAVARREVGIASDASIRVIDSPTNGPLRSSGDIALVILGAGDGSASLILVGYIGVDPNPHAWIPDRALYAVWYEQFARTSGLVRATPFPGLSFEYPADWLVTYPHDNSMMDSALVTVASAPLLLPCGTCQRFTTPPGAIVVEFRIGSGPAAVDWSNATLRVGGEPARREDWGPVNATDAQEGHTWTVRLGVRRDLGIYVSLKGPNLPSLEAEMNALIASVQIDEAQLPPE